MGVSGHPHAPAALNLRGKDPRYPLDRSFGGPKSGQETEARGKVLSLLPVIDPRSPGRPSRSQTLYWLSYPAHIRLGIPRKLRIRLSCTWFVGPGSKLLLREYMCRVFSLRKIFIQRKFLHCPLLNVNCLEEEDVKSRFAYFSGEHF
jgi:hypothetical protein